MHSILIPNRPNNVESKQHRSSIYTQTCIADIYNIADIYVKVNVNVFDLSLRTELKH